MLEQLERVQAAAETTDGDTTARAFHFLGKHAGLFQVSGGIAFGELESQPRTIHFRRTHGLEQPICQGGIGQRTTVDIENQLYRFAHGRRRAHGIEHHPAIDLAHQALLCGHRNKLTGLHGFALFLGQVHEYLENMLAVVLQIHQRLVAQIKTTLLQRLTQQHDDGLGRTGSHFIHGIMNLDAVAFTTVFPLGLITALQCCGEGTLTTAGILTNKCYAHTGGNLDSLGCHFGH